MEEFNLRKYLAEGKLFKEGLSITGEYEGEPVVHTGVELEDSLMDMLPSANSPDDFVRKVEYGMTDETSNLSQEDQEKLRQFFEANSQSTPTEESNLTEYEKVVSGLESLGVPSRVKLEEDGTINIELGFDYPDSLAGKVFDLIDELGVKAHVSAETSVRGIESTTTNGGPQQYERENRYDGEDEEWYN
jgi:hypothetical protein